MPTKKTAPPPAAPEAMPETYEAAMSELEQLVRSLETGQMPLEELLAQHQRAIQCEECTAKGALGWN